MDVKTSIGEFSEKEFIKRCNEKSFPDGLPVMDLDLCGCDSLTALPAGIKVRGEILVDTCSIKRYTFRDLPKILHLPFTRDRKQIIRDRLQKGY